MNSATFFSNWAEFRWASAAASVSNSSRNSGRRVRPARRRHPDQGRGDQGQGEPEPEGDGVGAGRVEYLARPPGAQRQAETERNVQEAVDRGESGPAEEVRGDRRKDRGQDSVPDSDQRRVGVWEDCNMGPSLVCQISCKLCYPDTLGCRSLFN